MKTVILLCLCLAIFGKYAEAKPDCFDRSHFTEVPLKYATKFKILNLKNDYILEIYSKNKKSEIIFSKNKNCQNIPTFNKKISKALLLYTSHISFIELLNEVESIHGISDFKFVYNRKLRKRKNILKLGSPPSHEKIYQSKADIFFTGSESQSNMAQLARGNVPLVSILEFAESHPLGRAEWIKVFGLFYQKFKKSEGIFNSIVAKYNETKELTKNLVARPIIAAGRNYNGIWKAPGGTSDLAILIKDAGGVYLWRKDSTKVMQNIIFEKAYQELGTANIWLPQSEWVNKNDILNEDKRYKNLKLFKNDMVFNNNLKLNSAGGNEYWERGLVRPDLLIQDYLKIFHPSLAQNKKLNWYQKLR